MTRAGGRRKAGALTIVVALAVTWPVSGQALAPAQASPYVTTPPPGTDLWYEPVTSYRALYASKPAADPELAKLQASENAAEKEVVQCRSKLGNEAFVGKAPRHVVDKIQGRLAAAEADLARIESALKALPAA